MIDTNHVVMYDGRAHHVIGCWLGFDLMMPSQRAQFEDFSCDPDDPSWGSELAAQWCIDNPGEWIYYVKDFSTGKHSWIPHSQLD